MSKIKDARIKLGLTQHQFADLTGVPFRTIQNWENGVTKCPDYVERLLLEWLHSRKSTARWKGAGLGDYYCSLCCSQYSGGDEFNYCPNCGAKMDK